MGSGESDDSDKKEEKKESRKDDKKESLRVDSNRKASGSRRKKSKDDKDDGLKLKPGEVVTNAKHGYVILKLLGEGGFGAVYRLATSSTNRSPLLPCCSASIGARRRSSSFLVMELVGMSLDDLKRERPGKVFSMGTGIGAAIQCLEAVQDLHKHGFIHRQAPARDLKPANYACGLKYKRHIIYLLDFGIARRIVNDENRIKGPRSYVGFKGTVRFASINCHKNLELGPEGRHRELGERPPSASFSFSSVQFYLLLDLSVQGGLPTKADVLKVKEECRREKRPLLFNMLVCANTFGLIMDYIDGLQYEDHADYRYIYKLLHCAANECGVNPDAPYDWELDANRSDDAPESPVQDGHRPH
ncbi:Protein kinase domain-containing protein [Aphelenchoides fujianensis]|nr:Protein kinase domain-containing protein [Aphelenchoides fujianensis]